MTVVVEILTAEAVMAEREALADILADCVAGNASISFMPPFGPAEAAAWWDGVAARAGQGHAVVLGARLDGRLVGSVQLGLGLPPNQPHRADVNKLIVRRDARGHGVGDALMSALEAEARRRGLTLLVLDTASPAAERIYRRLGWTEAGTIPGYALLPDGAPCDTTLFWKAL